MKVRLGYVSISNKLGKKVTSSSTVTFKSFSKIIGDNNKLEKLKSVLASNISDLEKILKYNIDNNIHFYRITSKLIPLVTHPEVGYYGHREMFKKDFHYIGKLIKDSNMRIDTHPDQFNVINSIKDEVVNSTITNLNSHKEFFEDINYPYGKMVIHIGGATGSKEEGIKRFINNFNKISKGISSLLILENDDKTYNVKEVLNICNSVKVPMVLDVHHHNCNNEGEDIEEYLERVFNTWQNEHFPPKIHFSSPREFENDRKHSDFINPEEFNAFINKARNLNKDFDVMLECKEKDIALYKLVEDLKEINPLLKWIDNSTFEY